MMPPTSIDGTDITGATIDGTDVTEITVDGQTVFTSVFSYFDDFSTNTISDYELYDQNGQTGTGFSISGGELQQFDDNANHFAGYDVSSENLSDFFLELEVVEHGDNDDLGLGFVVDNSTMVIATIYQQSGDAYLGVESFPSFYTARTATISVSSTGFSSFTPPFTQRLEYDSSANQATFLQNGSTVLTHTYSHSGTVTLAGPAVSNLNPGPHWDSIEIGSL